jgi:GDPmannose 4,6-dehydratase
MLVRPFEEPAHTADCVGLGTLRLLECIRILDLKKKTKFYQASSSELYGDVRETPQSETTPFYPRSPYAIAKLYAYWITINYRESYGIYACNGILFNHESPRRGENFVTRKITMALARIKLGLQDCLYLGQHRCVKRLGAWQKTMCERSGVCCKQDSPEDFVIATGKQYSVREFVSLAAQKIDMDIVWKGSGLDERGYFEDSCIVKIDKRHFRAAEVNALIGDSTKAKIKLGWHPEITFDELVSEMMLKDLKAAKGEILT